MAFTYQLSTDRGKVRFATGDTEASRALLDDDEVDYLLELHGSVSAAVVPALDAMITKASHGVTFASGGESMNLSDRLKQLRQLRAEKVAAGFTDASGSSTSRVTYFRRDEDEGTEYSQ